MAEKSDGNPKDTALGEREQFDSFDRLQKVDQKDLNVDKLGNLGNIQAEENTKDSNLRSNSIKNENEISNSDSSHKLRKSKINIEKQDLILDHQISNSNTVKSSFVGKTEHFDDLNNSNSLVSSKFYKDSSHIKDIMTPPLTIQEFIINEPIKPEVNSHESPKNKGFLEKEEINIMEKEKPFIPNINSNNYNYNYHKYGDPYGHQGFGNVNNQTNHMNMNMGFPYNNMNMNQSNNMIYHNNMNNSGQYFHPFSIQGNYNQSNKIEEIYSSFKSNLDYFAQNHPDISCLEEKLC